MQGIAALNAPQAAPQPSQFTERDVAIIDRGMNGALRGLNPQYRAQIQELADELNGMSAAQLQEILRVISMLEGDPQNYAQNLQRVTQRFELDIEDFPAEYNDVFFKILRGMVQQALINAQNRPEQGMETEQEETETETEEPEQMEELAFAKGGIASIKDAARMVKKAGRRGDSMLAHITPSEAAALKRMGGSGTINPRTGLREYGLWKSVKSVFKKAAPVIGTIALGVVSGGLGLGLSPAVIGAVGSGLGSLAAGAKPADALKSALIGGLGAGVMSGVGSYMSGGSFTEGFSSAFPSFLGGTAGAPGSYDLMGNLTQKLGFGGAEAAGVPGANGLPVINAPMPPVPSGSASWADVPAGGSIYDVPGRVVGAPVGAGTSVAADVAKTASGSSGGLGGLFSDKWKTAALIGGGAALLAGMGASDRPQATSLIKGPTGTDLLKQNPGTYGFNVADFRPTTTTAPSATVPNYIATPMVAPSQGVPFNFREVQYPRLNAKDGGHINGPGTGTSDSIPARLSDGEFVMTAAAVRGAGGGDRMKGARKMYELMHKFERMA